jgi:CBS domain-containing protein
VTEEKKIKDIMIPIEEYDKISIDARLCDALSVLRGNYEHIKERAERTYHKTIFITDKSGKIVGKLSSYDLIRGLVPDPARKKGYSRAYESSLSSRVLEAAKEIGETEERFMWLRSTFFDLVKNEARKEIKEIMSPVHNLLKEDDNINKAIYVMFKENIRKPLVVRGDEVVGVLDFAAVFSELLEIVGPECYVNW